MNSFTKLGLSQEIANTLEDLGFKAPTAIQEKAIPILLTKEGCDFIGLAQTGTGKTAAFGLPLIDLVDENKKEIQALILAPTRELVQQTSQQLKNFSKGIKKLNTEVVYGGANITTQINYLKKPVHILSATPGRLLDLIKRKALSLENVKYVILDEADEMLNMGFQEDIDEILKKVEGDRSIWLFSATMPGEIRKIIKNYMKDPQEVAVNTKQKNNEDISHHYVLTKGSNKLAALKRILDMNPEMRGVMFCRTRRDTQEIADKLSNEDYNVEALHGDLSQSQRDAVMKRFKRRSMQLLIATDVAARGIDVEDLSHVIQHSLPDQLEVYTHRSGRTGRAGRKGTSIILINPNEMRTVKTIEKKLNISFKQFEVPGRKEIVKSRILRWAEVIKNLKENELADELLESIEEGFVMMSKEEILRKLISLQLDNMNVRDLEDDDLNIDMEKMKEPDTANEHRFFINLGTIDGLTSGELVHLLSDVSGVKRKNFGEIELKRNCSFFYIKKDASKGITQKFEGLEIDGRAIRVNRDDVKAPNSGSKKSNNKKRRPPRRDQKRRGGRRRR